MTRIEKFDRWVARHVVVHPVHFYGIRNICEIAFVIGLAIIIAQHYH